MRIRYIIIFLVGLALLSAGIYIVREFNRTHQDLSAVQADYVVEATELIREFETDDSLANRKYLGKVVAVEGVVKNIDQDVNYHTVVLGDATSMSSVRCSMDTGKVDVMQRLKQGARVTIKGSFIGFKEDETGLLGSDVEMVRCVVEDSSKKKKSS